MIRILVFVMFAALLLTSLFVSVRQPAPMSASASASDKSAMQNHAADRHAQSSEHGVARRIPARETRVRTGSPTRPGSLRWHSFLPGMFR